MGSVAVTVLGHDRPGIIAEVTAVVESLGGNLEDSSMTLLRGHFAWMLIAELGCPPELLAERLAHLTADGLVVSVLPVPEEPSDGEALEDYVLSVHGADRPGIVAAVTRILADHAGNIVDLSTRLGTSGMYVLVAEVVLPPAVDVERLAGQLREVGQRLGVDVTLRPIDSDVF